MNNNLWKATSQYEKAMLYAYRVHDGQKRKGTEIPYISHLLAVSGIVLENGGTEAEAIGALLHDAIEDQKTHKDRLRVKHEIREYFGLEVLNIVEGCSDTLAESVLPPGDGKIDWKIRKTEYIDKVRNESASVRLVSSADKLHNARAILADYREIGDALWDRFNRKDKKEHLWYYRKLTEAFIKTNTAPRIVEELNRVVSAINGLIKKNGKLYKFGDRMLTEDEILAECHKIGEAGRAWIAAGNKDLTDEELEATGAINTTPKDDGDTISIVNIGLGLK
ncbi:MAG TPA: HD domain-containing protein [Methylotenera sp.]